MDEKQFVVGQKVSLLDRGVMVRGEVVGVDGKFVTVRDDSGEMWMAYAWALKLDEH